MSPPDSFPAAANFLGLQVGDAAIVADLRRHDVAEALRTVRHNVAQPPHPPS